MLVDDESDDDVEIVEDENGQCTVRIKPKPIKLKIINLHATQNAGTSNKLEKQGKKRKLSASEESGSTNGHLNHQSHLDLESSELIPAAKRPRQDSGESTEDRPKTGRPKTPQQRDTRTHCDKVHKIT